MKDPVGWLIDRFAEGSSHAGLYGMASGTFLFLTAGHSLPQKAAGAVAIGFGIVAFVRPDKAAKIEAAEKNVASAVADGLAQAKGK